MSSRTWEQVKRRAVAPCCLCKRPFLLDGSACIECADKQNDAKHPECLHFYSITKEVAPSTRPKVWNRHKMLIPKGGKGFYLRLFQPRVHTEQGYRMHLKDVQPNEYKRLYGENGLPPNDPDKNHGRTNTSKFPLGDECYYEAALFPGFTDHKVDCVKLDVKAYQTWWQTQVLDEDAPLRSIKKKQVDKDGNTTYVYIDVWIHTPGSTFMAVVFDDGKELHTTLVKNIPVEIYFEPCPPYSNMFPHYTDRLQWISSTGHKSRDYEKQDPLHKVDHRTVVRYEFPSEEGLWKQWFTDSNVTNVTGSIPASSSIFEKLQQPLTDSLKSQMSVNYDSIADMMAKGECKEKPRKNVIPKGKGVKRQQSETESHEEAEGVIHVPPDLANLLAQQDVLPSAPCASIPVLTSASAPSAPSAAAPSASPSLTFDSNMDPVPSDLAKLLAQQDVLPSAPCASIPVLTSAAAPSAAAPSASPSLTFSAADSNMDPVPSDLANLLAQQDVLPSAPCASIPSVTTSAVPVAPSASTPVVPVDVVEVSSEQPHAQSTSLNVVASEEEGLSDYEKQRLANIARNQDILAELGLVEREENPNPKKKQRRKSKESPPAFPLRTSDRLATKEAPDYVNDDKEGIERERPPRKTTSATSATLSVSTTTPVSDTTCASKAPVSSSADAAKAEYKKKKKEHDDYMATLYDQLEWRADKLNLDLKYITGTFPEDVTMESFPPSLQHALNMHFKVREFNPDGTVAFYANNYKKGGRDSKTTKVMICKKSWRQIELDICSTHDKRICAMASVASTVDSRLLSKESMHSWMHFMLATGYQGEDVEEEKEARALKWIQEHQAMTPGLGDPELTDLQTLRRGRADMASASSSTHVSISPVTNQEDEEDVDDPNFLAGFGAVPPTTEVPLAQGTGSRYDPAEPFFNATAMAHAFVEPSTSSRSEWLGRLADEY